VVALYTWQKGDTGRLKLTLANYRGKKRPNLMPSVRMRVMNNSTIRSDTPRFTTIVAELLTKCLNKVGIKIRINALIDTGCSKILINKRVISLEIYTNTKKT